jgi:hypothetical protein
MNKRRVFLGFVFTVLICVGVAAQDKPQILVNLSQNDRQGGRIEIVQPEQVENMLMRHIANNRLQKGIPGYRIRIFSQSGQTALARTDQTRASFKNNFPGIEAYKEYNTPNFQIFVGDFRTKNEALRELKQIKNSYPGAFIVSATIQIPKN